MWRSPLGLRGVRVKGGKTRDIPLPPAVTKYLEEYVQRVLSTERAQVGLETPLFWFDLGASYRRQDARAHDGEEHLAAM